MTGITSYAVRHYRIAPNRAPFAFLEVPRLPLSLNRNLFKASSKLRSLLGLYFLPFWPLHFLSFWPFGPSFPFIGPSFPFILPFWAFISFHLGLLGLHFLSFWPCGPSFPFIWAFWAFISLDFGLLGLHFLSFWPFGPSFPFLVFSKSLWPRFATRASPKW